MALLVLQVHRLSCDFAWLDAGTNPALQEALARAEAIESHQDLKVSCPEEAVLLCGFIDLNQFQTPMQCMPVCDSRAYLQGVATEKRKD
jgi:glucose-1-phosphate thymidylyltransferase